MQFSDDRLLRLSGLSSRDEYRSTILKESVGSTPDEEIRLREAIRKEVRAVIEEVLAERDANQIEKARQTKSVAKSLGYGGTGYEEKSQPNRAVSRGPAGMKGFGGPGFM
jgi:hypothetical protein